MIFGFCIPSSGTENATRTGLGNPLLRRSRCVGCAIASRSAHGVGWADPNMNGPDARRIPPHPVFQLFLVFCVVVTMSPETHAASDVLIGFQTQSWRYLDYGYQPDPAWFSTNYSDAGWENNACPFGYGEG